MAWSIYVKMLTGVKHNVQLINGGVSTIARFVIMREGTTLLVLSIVIASTPRCTLQATTVGELKQQVNAKDAALLPYLQRLTFQGPGE